MTRWGEEGRGAHRIVSARSRRGPSQRERWDAPVLRALPAAWLSWSAADLRSRLAAEATKVRRETGAAARRVGRARRYIACAGSVRESVYGGGEGRGRGLARLRRRGRRQRWRQAASLRVGGAARNRRSPLSLADQIVHEHALVVRQEQAEGDLSSSSRSQQERARRTNEAFAAETKEERVWTTQLRKLDRPRERRRGYSYMRKGRRPDEEKEGIEGCEGARRGGSARSRGKSTTRTDVRDMGRSRASPSRRAGPEGRGGNAAVRQGAVDAPAGARGPCERGQQFVLDGASTNEKKRARTCRRPCSPLPSLPHRPRPRRRARGGSCAGPPARPGRPPSSAPRGSWAGTPVGVDLHQPDARTASRDEQKGRRRTSSWWTNSVRGATQNRLAWTKANASSWLSPVLIMT